MRGLLSGVALFCVAIGVVQLGFLLFAGRRETRRARARAAAPGGAAAEVVDAVFALVPALDEELVIEATVRGLLDQDDRLVVVVVDDASDDRTGELAAAVDPERVTVLRRSAPFARLGKGPALNAGIAEVRRVVAARGLDPARVLVLVMDADGRLSEGAVAQAARLFEDPGVGGAQLGVRMRNRSTNWITLVQDCEFWGVAALGQMGRVSTGTVSLGGNGQFTRLQALDDLGRRPWSRSLTEDLDLAVSLAVRGWRLTSTPDAWVSQQAVEDLRGIVRQRTRWFQGHMTAANHRLREVWSSRRLTNAAVLELSSYLLIPYLMVLPWSILSQATVYYVATDLAAGRGRFEGVALDRVQPLLVLAGWYLISFLPTIICGIVYSRRERRMPLLRSVAFAHLLLVWNYAMFVACWAALLRIWRGKTGWEKTRRLAEPTPEVLAA